MIINHKKKLVFISSTIIFTETFLYNLILKLQNDYQIYLITNTNGKKFFINNKSLKIIHLPFKRKINFFNDLFCLFLFIFYSFKIGKHHSISMTPKGAIYGSISKLINPSSKRIHIFTGQIWANYDGIKRTLFKFIDKLTIKFSNYIFFDSNSQIKYIKKNGLKFDNSFLISSGSIKGVNLSLFKFNEKLKFTQKKRYKLKNNDLVLMFIGRISEDKGIKNILKAFTSLNRKYNFIHLFLIGKDEMNLKLYLEENNLIKHNIHLLNHKIDIHNYLNFADIVCLPSYREGFGSIIIEASSMNIPILGSDIYGTRDCLINNFNGLRFNTYSQIDLEIKLKRLISNSKLRNQLGINGRKFVEKRFNHKIVINNFYEKLVYLLK